MLIRTIALIVHLVGAVLWVGGTVSALTVAALAGRARKENRAPALHAARRVGLLYGGVGIVLAWVGGLTVLIPSFSEHYARAGWMHTKLTLLVVMAAVTGISSGVLRRAAGGNAPVPIARLRIFAAVLLVGMVSVISLAVFF